MLPHRKVNGDDDAASQIYMVIVLPSPMALPGDCDQPI
jgi:hypothetical protein